MLPDAIILCGGKGRRLKSVTGTLPKVLVEINGRPFLDYLIQYLQSQKAGRIILSTGYAAAAVERHCRRRFPELDLIFSRERAPLGTGGAVKKASALVRGKEFFVLNGDSFCRVDLKKMLGFHRRQKAQATLAVSRVESRNDYGSIRLDRDFQITAFAEKLSAGRAGYVNAGVYCFQQDIRKLMPKANRFSIERDFFPKLAGKKFYGFPVKKNFFDIGTPERLKLAQKVLLKSALNE